MEDEQQETLFLGCLSQMLHHKIIQDVSGQTDTRPSTVNNPALH